MTCYHPLKAWPVGLTSKNKTKYYITSHNIDHLEIDINNKIKNVDNKTVSPYADQVLYESIEIPCGQCIGCRLDYSRQWADRCMLEMKQHKESYFITLTYDDEHLHLNDYVDKTTGVMSKVASLDKRDFQLFMKRLRKNMPDYKLRFFAAGEYGDTTFRPHYHAIIFGLHLDDLIFYKRNCLGQNLYLSPTLEYAWSHPVIDLMTFKKAKCDSDPKDEIRRKIGHVVIAPASWETCAYVARYMLKKQKGETSSIYQEYNFEPEFSLMSRKPGLGRDFFDKKGVSMFDTDCLFISSPEGGRRFYPGRYYKKLFEAFDEDQFVRYKDLKELTCRDIVDVKMRSTSKTYLDALATEEEVKKTACKSLKRVL